MRGNNVMIGYYNDPEATDRPADGSIRGPGGVAPDGYIGCRTVPRTSSSPGARTSRPSRWNRRSSPIQLSWKPRSWPCPTTSGEAPKTRRAAPRHGGDGRGHHRPRPGPVAHYSSRGGVRRRAPKASTGKIRSSYCGKGPGDAASTDRTTALESGPWQSPPSSRRTRQVGDRDRRGLREAPDVELVAVHNPNRTGEWEGIPYVGEPGDVDVIVEAAPAGSVMDNLARWRPTGAAVVVGTSGFTRERIEEVQEMWKGAESACLIVPNFSIGAVLMMRFAELAAPHFATVEIIERHSERKPDAPSGTALQTAARVAAAGGRSAPKADELVEGSLGGDVEGVHVHSLRLAGLLRIRRWRSPARGATVDRPQSASCDSFGQRRRRRPGSGRHAEWRWGSTMSWGSNEDTGLAVLACYRAPVIAGFPSASQPPPRSPNRSLPPPRPPVRVRHRRCRLQPRQGHHRCTLSVGS